MFYGFQIDAPWPDHLPPGKYIARQYRHCTLVFLGKKSFEHNADFPQPSFQTAPVGFFSKCIFLPKNSSRVVSWEMEWFTQGIEEYQNTLETFFLEKGFQLDQREWLAHVSIARKPEERDTWLNTFEKLPFIVIGLHLYESLGNSNYTSHWKHSFHPPFCELSHTADLAFILYGIDLLTIYHNALIALAYTFPKILSYYEQRTSFDSLDDIIITLNSIIEHTDREIGCPFKAVSFSGEIEQRENTLLQWEMIVDV